MGCGKVGLRSSTTASKVHPDNSPGQRPGSKRPTTRQPEGLRETEFRSSTLFQNWFRVIPETLSRSRPPKEGRRELSRSLSGFHIPLSLYPGRCPGLLSCCPFRATGPFSSWLTTGTAESRDSGSDCWLIRQDERIDSRACELPRILKETGVNRSLAHASGSVRMRRSLRSARHDLSKLALGATRSFGA